MKKILFLNIFILIHSFSIQAQTGVAINKNGTAPDASALLDVSGNDGGVLIPRMTAVQRAAISSPATGLVVYDTDSTRFYYYDGGWNTIANPHQLGDGTNYAEFEDDGSLIFYGSSTTYEDLQVPALNTVKSANAPTLVDFIGGTMGYSFATNGMEQVFFSVQIPHAWEEGSDLYPHVHYAALDTVDGGTNADTVVWGLEYTWTNAFSTFPSTETIYAYTVVKTENLHTVVAFENPITPTSSQNKISSILMCRLFREPGNSRDTFRKEIILLQFDIHYKVNTLGSRTEWIK